jgi:DNA repair photolyase
VQRRPSENPHNRFAEHAVEYDDGEGPPPASVTLLEDASRSILSHNDSPDVGFEWSVNPYRGCLHACSYCMDGDTLILMGDGSTRRLGDLRVGDEIYGTRLRGRYRYYERTRVLAHWSSIKVAHRVCLTDGTELIASDDHRFLTRRGWKHVTGSEQGASRRPHLTSNDALLGTGQFADVPLASADYRLGYLCGLLRGDATLKRYDYTGRRGRADVVHRFRLALVDLDALRRARGYLADLDVATTEFAFMAAHGAYREMTAIRAQSKRAFEDITAIIAWPRGEPTEEWHRGFLAGIFDAEGSRSVHILRISNTDPTIIERTVASLGRLGFDVVVERSAQKRQKPISSIRLRGGLREHLRFLHTTDPAIRRKWDLEGHAVKNGRRLGVRGVERVGVRRLFDITTGTGDFIANGVISHNCFARPTHEYLGLGAGTDFDTKILVKRRAPELLREAFEKKSWKGEQVAFSGVTDCYQAVERKLELTRGCLEVCLEFRNPVSIITKSALVERDFELIAALAREADASVHVSLAFADAEMSRALEPWVPSPERRLRVVETFARAGVRVGVLLAPMIPGLNDSQMIELLERAQQAGATSAGWVLLRLPGAVAPVFEERLRATMPLRADKIMNLVRETRGGGERLYDPRFGARQRGEGPYAAMIATVFATTVKRLGLVRGAEPERPSTFRRPPRPGTQGTLF